MKKTTKCFAVFEADFPDESQTDDTGNILVPGGRNILGFICDALRKTGVGPILGQHSFYGWRAEFQFQGIQIIAVLQYPEPWLLLVDAKASWWKSRSSVDASLRNGINLLDSVLHSDTRFKGVRWMNEAEFTRDQRAGSEPH